MDKKEKWWITVRFKSTDEEFESLIMVDWFFRTVGRVTFLNIILEDGSIYLFNTDDIDCMVIQEMKV